VLFKRHKSPTDSTIIRKWHHLKNNFSFPHRTALFGMFNTPSSECHSITFNVNGASYKATVSRQESESSAEGGRYSCQMQRQSAITAISSHTIPYFRSIRHTCSSLTHYTVQGQCYSVSSYISFHGPMINRRLRKSIPFNPPPLLKPV
jgi:hypothetical protein